MKSVAEAGGRLLSLDALRGFDVLFIMGLAPVVCGLCHVFGFEDGCWLVRQNVNRTEEEWVHFLVSRGPVPVGGT